MSIEKELQQASFRKVPFLVPRERVTKGKKTAIHEYLNSDERFIEEIGKTAPIFDLTCVIHGDVSLKKRTSFEAALSADGIGELIHPIYGKLDVKVIGNYRITSSDRDIGEHIFDVSFGVTRDSLYPIVYFAFPGELTSKAKENVEVVKEVVSKKFKRPSSPFNKDAAANDINIFIDNTKSQIRNIVDPITDNILLYVEALEITQNEIYKILDDPIYLVNTIDDLFSRFRNIASTPQNLYNSFNNLIAHAKVLLPTNTFLRRQRNNNSKIINDTFDLLSFNFLLESAAYTEFNTNLELNETQDNINYHYNTFFRSDEEINPNLFYLTDDIDIKNIFSESYKLFVDIFVEKEQKTWKIEEITPGKTSMALTSYKYFGDLDKLDIINQLNPSVNHCGFNESILSITK
jgi:prophage DNA circulation protein